MPLKRHTRQRRRHFWETEARLFHTQPAQPTPLGRTLREGEPWPLIGARRRTHSHDPSPWLRSRADPKTTFDFLARCFKVDRQDQGGADDDRCQRFIPPGQPGMTPRWAWSAESGVCIEGNAGSRIWFTLSRGILSEIYYPRTAHLALSGVNFSTSSASVSSIPSNTPVSTHRRYRRKTLFHLPYSSSRCRHCAPVRATHIMPSK